MVSEKDDPDNVRYVLPDDQTVEITANEETTVAFENILKKGSIEFTKVDKATGKPLAGVLFRILDADKNVVAEGRTGSDGIVRFDDLCYGSYFWQEAETISGYQAETSLHEFSITEHEQLITLTVENEKIPDAPKTGDNSNLALWLSLMGLSGAGLAGTVLFARKRRKATEE